MGCSLQSTSDVTGEATKGPARSIMYVKTMPVFCHATQCTEFTVCLCGYFCPQGGGVQGAAADGRRGAMLASDHSDPGRPVRRPKQGEDAGAARRPAQQAQVLISALVQESPYVHSRQGEVRSQL